MNLTKTPPLKRHKKMIENEVNRLNTMLSAVEWLEKAKDLYDIPMNEVKSADMEKYELCMSEYQQLSYDEKFFCDNDVVNKMDERKMLAKEKLNAIASLDEFFASLETSDYTEENQEKLKDIADLAKADIENASALGMAQNVLEQAKNDMNNVERIMITPVVITKPTASEIEKGESLSASKLTGGEADTQGKFEWKDANIVPEQTGEFTVVFTPNDNVKYTVVEFEVTVSVVEPMPTPDPSPVPPSTDDEENTGSDTEQVKPSVPEKLPDVVPTPEEVTNSDSAQTEQSTSPAPSPAPNTPSEENASESQSQNAEQTENASSQDDEPQKSKSLAVVLGSAVAAVIAIAAGILLYIKKKNK